MKKVLFVFVLFLPLNTFAQGTARYLIPLYVPDAINGAYGSLWVTELFVVNGSAAPIEINGFNLTCNITCSTPPLPPGITFDASDGLLPVKGTQGTYVSLPAEHAHDAAFHLRVRDLSREDVSWGAEIPVVHLDEARTVVNLVDIPRDDRYRTTLRMYDVTATEGATAHVRIYRPSGFEISLWPYWNEATKDGLLTELDVPFSMPSTDVGGAQWHPSYAEVTLVDNSALAGTGKLRIEVISSSPASRIWAFASITNNTTQQVSIVSPN